MPSARKLAPVLAALVLLAAAPAFAGGFSLYGSWWDTDAAGDTLGAGVRIGFGLVPGLDLDLRGSYFEEVDPEFLDLLGDGDDPRIEGGLQVLPIDIGLRLNIGQRSAGIRPYLGAGGTYYRLDTDFGEVDDEVGWYALFGIELGDERGARFFVEANYRTAEATVTEDPRNPSDIPDLDFEDGVEIPLDGLGVNVGLTWSW